MKKNTEPIILIVDDSLTNLIILVDFLKDVGFITLVAKNGQDAINNLELATPDLILLDVMMPGLDGFETCRKIKENPQYKNIPVIFMTALSDISNKVKGLSLGAVDYITKPFQQEELIARINLQLKLQYLTTELAEKNAKLREWNALLEQKVEERTDELQKAQSQLLLNDKMSSLGQLVAGIAHEINNPVSFIAGNLNHAKSYAEQLIDLVKLYQKYDPSPAPEIIEKIESIELDYLIEDFLQLIVSMEEGTNRIAEISQSMRTFSRADSDNRVKFNIHEGIDSTLLILKHRLKSNPQRPAIEIVKEYGDFPEIECYPGQLNQVFMNVLSNAVDAVEESNIGRSFADIKANPNQITIITELVQDKSQVNIRIKDNGVGINPEVQNRIFDYLFTTKQVGKGTGLGLSIVRQIIENKHGGLIDCISKAGYGTEFVISLPFS